MNKPTALSGARAYAIVDLAAAAPLRMVLTKADPETAMPLFDPKAFPYCVPVGPWLVDLKHCPAVLSAWRQAGRQQNWGYLAHSAMPIKRLRSHFRRFNTVFLSNRKEEVLFRYFDPVVMIHCLERVFSEAQKFSFMYLLESLRIKDEMSGTILHYPSSSKDGHRQNSGPLVFSRDQCRMMDELVIEDFCRDLAFDFAQGIKVSEKPIFLADLFVECRDVVLEAHKHGVRSRRRLAEVATLSLMFGRSIFHIPEISDLVRRKTNIENVLGKILRPDLCGEAQIDNARDALRSQTVVRAIRRGS